MNIKGQSFYKVKIHSKCVYKDHKSHEVITEEKKEETQMVGDDLIYNISIYLVEASMYTNLDILENQIKIKCFLPWSPESEEYVYTIEEICD